MKLKIETDITIQTAVVVEYRYHANEARTPSFPGVPAYCEILSVVVDKMSLDVDALKHDTRMELETQCLAHWLAREADMKEATP